MDLQYPVGKFQWPGSITGGEGKALIDEIAATPGKVRAAVRPVVGPHRASRFLLHVAKLGVGVPTITTLNGQPATVFMAEGRVASAMVLDILAGLIVGVRVVNNPDKLGRLTAPPAAPPLTPPPERPTVEA